MARRVYQGSGFRPANHLLGFNESTILWHQVKILRAAWTSVRRWARVVTQRIQLSTFCLPQSCRPSKVKYWPDTTSGQQVAPPILRGLILLHPLSTKPLNL